MARNPQIGDIMEFSLVSKRMWNEVHCTNYNWNQRILKDFASCSLAERGEALSFQDYVNQYTKWKTVQNWYTRTVHKERDTERMLVRARVDDHT